MENLILRSRLACFPRRMGGIPHLANLPTQVSHPRWGPAKWGILTSGSILPTRFLAAQLGYPLHLQPNGRRPRKSFLTTFEFVHHRRWHARADHVGPRHFDGFSRSFPANASSVLCYPLAITIQHVRSRQMFHRS